MRETTQSLYLLQFHKTTTQNPCPLRVSLPEQTDCENEKYFKNRIMDAATVLTPGCWPETMQSLAGTTQPPRCTLQSGHK